MVSLLRKTELLSDKTVIISCIGILPMVGNRFLTRKGIVLQLGMTACGSWTKHGSYLDSRMENSYRKGISSLARLLLGFQAR